MEILKTISHQNYDGDCMYTGERVESYTKTIGDIANLYVDYEVAKRMGDKEAYTVVSDEEKTDNPGTLLWGVTYLRPYLVNEECSFTRGHFHEDSHNCEYYMGLSGEGLLLLWDGTNDFKVEKIERGSMHHIDGRYAHRLVNTSTTETLACAACWNVITGHDYERINKTGFPYRVFLRNGEISIEESK